MQVIKWKKLLDNEDVMGNMSPRNGFNEIQGDNEQPEDDRHPNEGRVRIHSPLSIEVETEVHALNTVDDSILDQMLSTEYPPDFTTEIINCLLFNPLST